MRLNKLSDRDLSLTIDTGKKGQLPLCRSNSSSRVCHVNIAVLDPSGMHSLTGFITANDARREEPVTPEDEWQFPC